MKTVPEAIAKRMGSESVKILADLLQRAKVEREGLWYKVSLDGKRLGTVADDPFQHFASQTGLPKWLWVKAETGGAVKGHERTKNEAVAALVAASF